MARPGASAAGYLENGCGVVGWPISPGLYAGRIGDLRADRSVLPGLLEDDLFRVPFELRTICESERLQTITIARPAMTKEQIETHLRYEGPDVDDGTMVYKLGTS